MKNSQIKKLADSIVKYDGLSTRSLEWIFSSFAKKELKTFKNLLLKRIKDNSVVVSFSGELSDESKKRIGLMFPSKRIYFKRDDKNIVAGMCFKYGDFVMDFSISGAVERILNSIRERL
jgi:F-type H+-transporting ATPase subunit delta